jgi:hypothetical protein
MAIRKIFVGEYINNFPIHVKLEEGDVIVNASNRELAIYNEQGQLPEDRLPPLAIKDTFVVGSENEMLQLTAQRGDIAIRYDISKTFILKEDNPLDILSWRELATPIDSILTVFGRTGHISSEYGDYTASQILFNSSNVLNAPDVQSALENLAVNKSAIGHTHLKEDITDFAHTHELSELNGFDVHTHTKSDITDFAHTHLKEDITDFAHTHVKSEIIDFNHTHTQNESHFSADTDISDLSLHHTLGTGEFQAAKGNHLHNPLDIGAVPMSMLNVGNGVATLDQYGKLKASQVPKIAITDTYVVNSETEMLSLTAEIGDVAVRTDLHRSFILKVNNPTILTNWKELETPTDLLLSFNGRLGHIIPQYGDYDASQITIDNYPPDITQGNLQDVLYHMADLVHEPNTDIHLGYNTTKKIYVDCNRTEIYNPTGIQSSPFKTINDAINFITTNNYEKVTLKIQNGEYAEDILIDNLNISIIGDKYVKINGNLDIINSNYKKEFKNLNINGSVNSNSGTNEFINCDILNISVNSLTSIKDSTISGNSGNNESVKLVNGSLTINNSNIIHEGFTNAILQKLGNLNITDCKVSNNVIDSVILIENGELYINGIEINNSILNNKNLHIQNCSKATINSVKFNNKIDFNDNGNINFGSYFKNSQDCEFLNDTNINYIFDERYYTEDEIDFILRNLNQGDGQLVYVSKLGNDNQANGSFGQPYLTIKAALNSINDASYTKRYTLIVGTGRFVEDSDLTFKDFVSIKGVSKETTYISKLNNSPIEYSPNNTYMTFKDITFGSGGIRIDKSSNLACKIDFESCNIEGFGVVYYKGKNNATNLLLDRLNINQTCKFPHIYTEDVTLTCHHTIIKKTVTCKGYMYSYLIGVHIGSKVSVDCKGETDGELSRLFIDNPSMPDELNKLVLFGITELHNHVKLLDSSYGSYVNNENFQKIQGRTVQEAIDSIDGFLHLENNDKYLTTERTDIIYVDCNRTDIYQANGSITKPYKTINEAIINATDNSVLFLNPGIYEENIETFQPIDIVGNGLYKTVIKGNVIINSGPTMLKEININGYLFINEVCKVFNCDILGCIEFNMTQDYAHVELFDCNVNSNNEFAPIQVDTQGSVTILNSRLIGKNNLNKTVDHSFGTLIIKNSYIEGNTDNEPVIFSGLDSVNSIIKIYNSEIINKSLLSSKDSLISFNNADNYNPNILFNIVSNGNIRTELTYTIVDGVIFQNGELFGSYNYFRSTNNIRNDSENIIGGNLTELLNKITEFAIDERPESPIPGKAYFDNNIQRPIWWNNNIGAWVDVHGNLV